MTLTELCPSDVIKLAYPFRREEHEFLEGYVYISEEAITDRIERVDAHWSFAIDEMIAYGDSVICRATLTIKGIGRSNVGGNPVQRDKQDKDKDGKKLGTYSMLPLYTVADNGVNAYKAAATDALKRCARLFGIGRYLLSAPKEGGMFEKWLEQQHADARVALQAAQKPVVVDTETGEITRVEAPPVPATPQQPAPAPSAAHTPARGGSSAPLAVTSPTQNGSPAQGGSPDDALERHFGQQPPGDLGDANHLPRDVEGMPVLGTLNMKALGKQAFDEKLVKGQYHFANLIDLLWRDGLIRAASKPEAVMDAIRTHEAAKDLAKEGVGAK